MIQSPHPDDDYIPLPTDLKIQSFRWLRSSTVHAIAKYDPQITVPFVWAGLWGVSEAWENSEGQQHLAGLDCSRAEYITYYTDHIEPSAWAIVAMDMWAAGQADTAIGQPEHTAIYLDGKHIAPVQLKPCEIRFC